MNSHGFAFHSTSHKSHYCQVVDTQIVDSQITRRERYFFPDNFNTYYVYFTTKSEALIKKFSAVFSTWRQKH